MTIEEQIIKTFQDTSGISPGAASGELDAVLGGITAEKYVIVIYLEGGVKGAMALVMGKNQARAVSSKMLTIAAGMDFPPQDIDDELASNSVGEIINIALGEYFMKRKNPAPVAISSPKYFEGEGGREQLRGLHDLISLTAEGETFYVLYRFS